MPPATGNLCELICATCQVLTVHRKDDAGRWWCEQCRLRQQLAVAAPPQPQPVYQQPPPSYGYGYPPPQYAAMPPPRAPQRSAFGTGMGLGCGCFTAIAVTLLLLFGGGLAMCAGTSDKSASSSK